MRVLLGSKSPRRSELLSMLEISFEVVSIDCEENFPEDIPHIHVAEYLSEKKSNAFKVLQDSDLLITADTMILVDNLLLIKPINKEESLKMLDLISDKTHQVITGVTMRTNFKKISFSTITDVTFNAIDSNDRKFYVDNYAVLDKAGGYGIQDWIGLSHVKTIDGCYYNVMGLPTSVLYKHLKYDFGHEI
jgi:septum formation protein